MKRLFPKRPRDAMEPTGEQLKEAERAMQNAVFRRHGKGVPHNSILDHVTVVVERAQDRPRRQDPLENLGRTSPGDFVSRFRVNGLECMTTTYEMIHTIYESPISGVLTTQLPEDVFHLIGSQLSLLDDYLRAASLANCDTGKHVVVDCLLSLLQNIWYHQTQYRDMLLHSLESCIAAANDFMRMYDRLDALMDQARKRFSFLTWKEGNGGDSITAVVVREVDNIATLLSTDAVYASQRAVNYIMTNIQTSTIATDLFTREWEDVMVHNEVALSIVKTYEDYLTDIANYLEHDFLYHKIVAGLGRATVCFYTQCFVKKAEKLRHAMKRHFPKKRAKRIAFLSTKRAITRMTHDVQIFRDYFRALAKDNPTLLRLVSDQLSIFVVLLECMWLAAGQIEHTSLEEYAVVVHKKISGANAAVTRYFLSDLWLLMGPKDEHHNIEHEVRMMETELSLLSAKVKKEQLPSQKATISEQIGWRLDEVLSSMYQDRILQETSSACTNILREVNDLRKIGQKEDESHNLDNRQDQWKPLKGFRQRMSGNIYDRELESLFQQL